MFKIILTILLLTLVMSAQAGEVLTEKLITQLLETKKAFVVSPYSVGAALSMTAEGAAGDTKKEFAKVLNLPWSNGLEKNNSEVFQSAQAVWVEQTYPVKLGFLDKLKKKYRAGFEKADFKDQSEEERLKINHWVEEKTKNKIKDLLSSGSLTSLTRLVLVNGVYFKDSWLQAFDKNLTISRTFQVAPGQSVEIETLNKKFKAVQYYASDHFESIQLPFKTKGFALRLFLPKDFEISSAMVKEILNKKNKHYSPLEMTVQFPKFKIDFEIELSENFKSLGLILPFSDRADFSKLSKVALVDRLRISLIQHKVFIEVNEEGAEAAAATAVVLKGRSMNPKSKEFIANRPFVYEIVRINSATSEDILFVGFFKPERVN
ncbi:MAG: serpin family protein [Moraxellaceae bacterium]|nr:serpin family protein [Pseudobdellovibrionaceae bacterium]